MECGEKLHTGVVIAKPIFIAARVSARDDGHRHRFYHSDRIYCLLGHWLSPEPMEEQARRPAPERRRDSGAGVVAGLRNVTAPA